MRSPPTTGSHTAHAEPFADIGDEKLSDFRQKTNQVRDLLAPLYNWFTEGFDIADLKDAQALLDALGA